jgi:hypothetical protein
VPPAYEAVENVGTDEQVVLDEARSGTLSEQAALRRLAADFRTADRTTHDAAARLGQLRLVHRTELAVRQMVMGLEQVSAVFGRGSSVLAAGQGLGEMSPILGAIHAHSRVVGLAALKLRAGECVPL